MDCSEPPDHCLLIGGFVFAKPQPERKDGRYEKIFIFIQCIFNDHGGCERGRQNNNQ